MKYIVYLTRNKKDKINGHYRIYVGVHKTKDPEIFDGYIGCGVKVLFPSSYMHPKSPFQYAVKKYGVNSFERTVLYVYNTAKEAYKKESEIVDETFVSLSFTYNVALGGELDERFKPLYQFNLKGELVKKWKTAKECYDFYGYPRERFLSPKDNKCAFLNSYWSTSSKIDVTKYSNKNGPNVIYLFNKDGKLLKAFSTQAECAKYLKSDVKKVTDSIKNQSLVLKKYYISNKVIDRFVPKPRKQYIDQDFYVYSNNKLLGKYHGKELMKVINLHSWDLINNIFVSNNNWYKDFYISLTKKRKIPSKKFGKGTTIDVYDKYGNFIEHLNSVKEAREKYNIPTSKIKNILLGNRYYGDYIFKYSK